MKDALQTVDKWIGHLTTNTQSGTSAVFTSGTMTTQSGTLAFIATTSGNNFNASASFGYSNAGSPFLQGTIFKGLNAEAVISGGMWVIGSEGVLKPAPASTQFPLGIATATTASGAACNVLVQGMAYARAEGTIGAGLGVMMGASNKLDTVQPAGAGSGARGICMTGAASGTTTFGIVYLF